ncbi:MAG: hypothetical protein ACI4CZ_00735, partial [Hominisplanchenecus sp.]
MLTIGDLIAVLSLCLTSFVLCQTYILFSVDLVFLYHGMVNIKHWFSNIFLHFFSISIMIHIA